MNIESLCKKLLNLLGYFSPTVLTIENGKELCIGCVVVCFFFSFFTQDQVPHISFRMGQVIYLNKALSFSIQTK